MAVDTYGLNLSGLSEASKKTVNWPKNSGGSTQISWNRATGEIITADHVGGNWTQYDDPDIVTVCHTERHMTMQQIADAIAITANHA